MTSWKNVVGNSIVYVVFIVLILGLIYITYPKSEDQDIEPSLIFPDEIGYLKLEDAYSGVRAKSEIKEMHLGDFDFISGHIGYYTDNHGGSAKYWVSVFSDDDDAQATTQRMTEKISLGNTPFSIPVEDGLNDSNVDYVYYVEGMGQDHYYWHKNDIVVWVAITNINTEDQADLVYSSIETIE